MKDLIIIDSDILIDAARGIDGGVTYLENMESRSTLAISAVTQMELMIGCRNKHELRFTNKFLERFEIISLNEQISDITVELLQEYRLSHGLLIADALIAATAISLQVKFVSRNQKDYRFISDLNLLSYP